MKRIKHVLLVLIMSMAMILAIGCGEKQPPFEFTKDVPTQMGITKEIYFRNYLEDNDEAEYKLYVSYFDAVNNVQVTEEEQSSLIFVLEQEGEYTFKIERDLDGKKAYLTCKVMVLPEAPKFEEGVAGNAKKGAVRTFGEIFTACQCVVTPGNLEQKLKFLSYDFVSVVEGVDDQMGVAIDTTATVDTDFTFVNEGVYTFTVKAENASGSAETKVIMNAFDKANAAQKVETTYNPLAKLLLWQAIDNATAYRVWVDDKNYVDVAENSFSFENAQQYPDKEYTVKIAPVFNGTIYKDSSVTKAVAVGRVHSPLTLSKDMDIVSWNERYFVESYTVIEGNQETVLDADTLSYTLKGSYETDAEVEVKVYATFDDGSVTETAKITVITGELGSVTFNRIDAKNGVASGVEWVAFDMEEASDVWFLSEFVGQNAPNYGIQVLNLTSEWDGSYTIKKTDPNNKLGYEYTPGGMLLCNSSEQAWTNINLYRGYITDDARGTVNDGTNVGLYRYQENVHYIQIVGYEIIKESENNSARLTSYLFTVSEDGTVTLVNKSSGEATWATHVLGGTYATYFGNIAVTLEKFGPESITFGYAKPAKTLNSLLFNITASYQYRDQLITLCEATEPSAEENFVPQRVLGERYNDGRDLEDDNGNNDDGNGDSSVGDDSKTTLSEQVTLKKIEATNGVTAEGTKNDYVSFDMGTNGGNVWIMTQFKGKNAPNYAFNANKSGLETWTAADASTSAANLYEPGVLITNTSESYNYYMQAFLSTDTSNGKAVANFPNSNGTLQVGSERDDMGINYFEDETEYIQIIGYEMNAEVDRHALNFTVYIFKISDGKAQLVYKYTPKSDGTANGSDKGFNPYYSNVVLYGNIHCDGLDNNPDSVTFSYEEPKTNLEDLVKSLDNNYAYKDDIAELLNITL